MAFPNSDIFNVLDWNQRASTTPDTGDALINAPSGSLLGAASSAHNVVSVSGGLLLTADATNKLLAAPELSTLKVSTAVPETFTFEFDVHFPADIPNNFENKDSRIFVGAVNRLGYTAGLLFSKQGVGVATTPYAEDVDIRILQGSSKYYFDDEGAPLDSLTVRCTVDGAMGRMTVYFGDTDVIYEEDLDYGAHDLAYSIPAADSTLPSDQILVALRSINSVAPKCQLVLKSLRLADYVVDSPEKPVVVVPEIDSAQVGRRLILDARASYSPDGTPLTFHWEIEEQPAGSTASLVGGSFATVSLGSVADDNLLTLAHRVASSYVNGFRVDVVAGNSEAPLSMLLLTNSHAQITLATDSDGTVLTTATELVQAFVNSSFPGYFPDVAAILGATVSDSVSGSGTVATGTFVLGGGIGSDKAKTSIQIDKPGIYRFSIRASDGTLISTPEIVSVTATLDRQLLGHRPNTNYIWSALPDFWKLVKDKAKISVVWSSFAQVISDELMRLLQHDYAKSIRDISRKFQRRWLSYEQEIPVPAGLQNSLVMSSGAHYFVEPDTTYLTVPTFSIVTRRGDIVDPNTGNPLPSLAVTPALSTCVVVNPNGVIGKGKLATVSDASPYTIECTTKAFQAVEIIDSGSFGLGLLDPDVVAVTPGVVDTDLFTSKGAQLKLQDIQVDDILIMEIDGVITRRRVAEVAPVDDGTIPGGPTVPDTVIPNAIRFDSGPTIKANNVKIPWQIVRPVSYCQVFQYPYFYLGKNVNLRPLDLQFGDAAVISYTSPLDDTVTEIQLPLLLTTTTEVFPDWRPLFDELNLLAKSLFDAGDPSMAGFAKAPEYSIGKDTDILANAEIRAIVRTSRIPVRADTVSIPKLGKSTVSAELTENAEFTITDGGIQLLPLVSSLGTTAAGSTRVYLQTPFDPNDNPTAVYVETGEIGVYSVTNYDPEGTYVDTAHTFQVSSTVDVHLPRYSFNQDLPSRLWAEVTFFDNWEAIENNFGLLVGLPKSLLDENNITVDYLSIVKALWFAFLQGPQVANIKVAAEAFMGLPYTEVGGQITVINPEESEDQGRIILKEVGKPGYRTYFYPTKYDIAINPDTGRQIKAVSLAKAAEYYLPKSEQEKLQDIVDDSAYSADVRAAAQLAIERAQLVEDANVRPYTGLVDAVKVYDYVSNPSGTAELLTGADVLKRFHTFTIQIPTEGLGSLDFLPVLRDFVEDWKPAHTQVLFFGVHLLEDAIDVEEDVYITTTLSVADSPYTSPYSKSKIQHPGTIQIEADDFTGVIGTGTSFTVTVTVGDVVWIEELGEGRIVDSILSDTLLTVVTPFSAPVPAGTALYYYDRTRTWPTDTIDDNAPPATWDYDNVIEKYESGYVSGVLDDYSGDGSWDSEHGVIEMVNSLDSDVDVMASKMWVPVTKNIGVAEEEFQIGEELELMVDFGSGYVVASGYGWDNSGSYPGSPPVVEHIGSGVHPKIPFGVESPQNLHTHTYLLLGFYQEDGNENCGTTNRLRALQRLDGEPDVRVRGKTSGAVADVPYVDSVAEERQNLDKAIDVLDAKHALHLRHFMLDYLCRVDKLLHTGPEVSIEVQPSMYIPDTGLAIAKKVYVIDMGAGYADGTLGETITEDAAPNHQGVLRYFDATSKIWWLEPNTAADTFATGNTVSGSSSGASFATVPAGVKTLEFNWLEASTPFIGDDKEIQKRPWNSYTATPFIRTLTDDEQMTPSFSPGFFVPYDSSGFPVTTNYRWGYSDQGELTPGGGPITWGYAGTATDLKNLHVGRRLKYWKSKHYTHGFVDFYVPKPEILKFTDGATMRIEGNYFVDYDSTQGGIPNASPSSFSGTNGGCWIFVRDSGGTETAVASVTFETGLNPAKTVLGISGVTQTSTGHVLEAPKPGGLSGTYDVIVRNYRPYKMSTGGSQLYHMDEAVYEDAFTV